MIQESSTRNNGFSNTFTFDNGSTTGPGNPTTMRNVSGLTYNADNQLKSSSYAYDGDGNPTTYNGQTLTFDGEDRMTSYGTSMTAGYTGDGLRAWKHNSSGTTYYLYSGMTPVCEMNASGTVTAVNTFGPDGLASRHSGSSSTFYTFDNQGGAAVRTDVNANLIGAGQFDAFGNRVASTDSSTDPYSGYGAQWGYYFDSETGLQLLGLRYYDSGTGRFVNRDPIDYDGGMNLYGYAANSPTILVDPSGQGPVPHYPYNPNATNAQWNSAAQGAADAGSAAGQLAGDVAVEVGSDGTATPAVAAALSREKTLLKEAEAARDALANFLKPFTKNRGPATVTGGYNIETGKVAAGFSGFNKCAEDRVVAQLGGDASKVRFTKAVRPRSGDEVNVCARCQTKYPREHFPPGTRFDPPGLPAPPGAVTPIQGK